MCHNCNKASVFRQVKWSRLFLSKWSLIKVHDRLAHTHIWAAEKNGVIVTWIWRLSVLGGNSRFVVLAGFTSLTMQHHIPQIPWSFQVFFNKTINFSSSVNFSPNFASFILILSPIFCNFALFAHFMWMYHVYHSHAVFHYFSIFFHTFWILRKFSLYFH